jgi:hypothetical protein
MLYSVQQAAEKLGVSENSVYTFIRQGHLTDQVARDPSKKKHYSKVDSKEVTALKPRITKGRVPRIRLEHEPAPAATPAKSNGTAGQTVAQLKQGLATSPTLPMTGLFTRLDRIESMLNELLTLWR